MKFQSTIFAIVYCALQLEGEAFTAPISANRINTASSLNLVPAQGNQLVAAYNAICEEKSAASLKEAPIQLDNNVDGNNKGAIAASRKFLTRIFHMPSIKHPGQKQHDVSYYPMLGFRFFKGTSTVLPTTSNVSCTLPTHSQKEEEVYGWFSSSCKLDLFSEEICHNPIGSEFAQ